MSFYNFIKIVKNIEYRDVKRFTEMKFKNQNDKVIRSTLNLSKDDFNTINDMYMDLNDDFIDIVKTIKRDYSLMK